MVVTGTSTEAVAEATALVRETMVLPALSVVVESIGITTAVSLVEDAGGGFDVVGGGF